MCVIPTLFAPRRWRLQVAGLDRGCAKTRNHFLRFQFRRIMVNKPAQNRTTREIFTYFSAGQFVGMSFHSLDPFLPLTNVRFEADDLGVRPPVMGNADAIALGVMCDPLRVARA
jgi:hypothetical protein